MFEEEQAHLETLSEQAKHLKDFIGFTQHPTDVDWTAYLECFERMAKTTELSKPYVLRALEASHRAALLFSDDVAVCDTMKATSSIGGALHVAVSGDELVSLLTAKTDAIIMRLLLAYVKERNGNGKIVRGGSLATAFGERVRVYTEFAEPKTSPIAQCLDVLRTLLVIVDPKRAKVQDLVVAAELMDSGKEDINSLILGERFFIKRMGGWVGRWVGLRD